jgi:hypothetical protein
VGCLLLCAESESRHSPMNKEKKSGWESRKNDEEADGEKHSFRGVVISGYL